LSKLTPDSMTRGRECLEQAIALDRGYALAHSELAAYFGALAMFLMRPAHEVMPLSRAAAEKALEIDPTLPEALAWLAMCAVIYEYNWKEAERLFKLALASEPVSTLVRQLYGLYLLNSGRAKAAAKEMERSLQEDPLNLFFRISFASCRIGAGQDADAARELQRILELDENYYMAHVLLSAVQYQRGELAEALASAEKAHSLAPWHPGVCGALAGFLRLTADSKRAQAILAKLGDGTAYGTPFGLFYYHLVCSEFDQAADWAEKAIEQRAPPILIDLRSPAAEALRRSARWPKLAKMMNLPVTLS
jgi:Tfp pilus assembly protein PilF